MKIIFIAVTAVVFLYGITQDLLLQADAPTTSSVAQIILAIGSVLGIVGGIISPIIVWYLNKISSKQNLMATKVDGLLEQKTAADKALGRVEALDTAAKEKAIADDRELQVRKEQDLLHQQPPNRDTKTDVKDVRESIESEIRKQGDKIEDAVKEKADEIKEEVPGVTADKVVDKLNPPKE